MSFKFDLLMVMICEWEFVGLDNFGGRYVFDGLNNCFDDKIGSKLEFYPYYMKHNYY
jgi:hypothetical protein